MIIFIYKNNDKVLENAALFIVKPAAYVLGVIFKK